MAELTEREKCIFDAAMSLDDAIQRAEYLDVACRGNPLLRQEIDSLLAADEHHTDFLRIPAAERITDAADFLTKPGTTSPHIGYYKLLQQIGEGGFGTVYMAEQQQPVYRRVALKVIKAGMDTKQVIARFEAERQALAMMDHPNIAKVLDGGATETGRPYFVMELVRGKPITEFCDQNELDIRARLELFIHVCHAVQHAHQKGIIHRDLKPSNVMVTLHDDQAVPKVIDFGIAKATEQRLTEKTVFTDFHQFLGTPAYMSPEQANLTGLDIDTRSDIYALGVLLYELLTGTTPYDQEKLRGLACDELCRVIREDRPPTPSSRVSTLGDQLAEICRTRSTEPGLLRRMLRGDVDWIVMKALEKDRKRRYETASAFASDIQHYLHHEPVLAGPPSTVYRLRKYVQRNRVAVTSAAVVVLAVCAGTVAATLGFVQARLERNNAITAQQETDVANQQLEQQLYLSDMSNAITAWDSANMGRVIDLLKRHVPRSPRKDLRTFEWYYLWRLTRRAADTPTLQHAGPVYTTQFAPQGTKLVTGGYGSPVTLWDLRTLKKEPLHTAEKTTASVAFSPDGRYLTWGTVRGVTLRDLETGTDKFLDGDTQMIMSVMFSPDGQLLAAGSRGGKIYVWAIPGLALRDTFDLQGDAVWLAFSPDSRTLASGDHQLIKLKFWDVGSSQELNLLKGNAEGAWNAAFSPTEDLLATSAATGKISLWSAHSGDHLGDLEGHIGLVWWLDFSPDGALLASGGRDNCVRIWDVKTRKPVDTLKGHSSTVRCVRFSPDGKTVASSSDDKTVKLWEVTKLQRQFVQTGGNVYRVVFSPGGDWIASNGVGGLVYLWDPDSGRKLEDIPLHSEQIIGLAVSQDGKSIVAGAQNGEMMVWDVESRQKTGPMFGYRGDIWNVAISPLDNSIACSSEDGAVRIWDLDSLQLKKTLPVDEYPGEGLAFSPDGKLLAAGNYSPRVRLWDVDTWLWTDLTEHVGGGFAIAFSPNGNTLATGGVDSQVILWKVARHSAGSPTAVVDKKLVGHGGAVWGLAFSPDGQTLVSGSTDTTVMLWDVASGEHRITFKDHQSVVHGVAFSPDGRTLVSSGNDGRIFFRRAASPEEVRVARW